jgi:hypothetical protein
VTESLNEECHIFLRTKYYSVDEINEDELGGVCSMCVGKGEAHEGIAGEM